jgi:predicted Zn-dependent peptidase
METEEAILERQVELVTPAQAKEAAAKIIRAKKQVTFLVEPAITKE